MSIWSNIFGKKAADRADAEQGAKAPKASRDPRLYAVVDCEVAMRDKKVHDIGAWRYDNATFHKPSTAELLGFLKDVDYVCGHNVVNHDAKYLFGDTAPSGWLLVDTLYMSPLLFPDRPYHHLVKDDKLMSDQINNPLNDCINAKELLADELAAWAALPPAKSNIYAALLADKDEFKGFISMAGADRQSADPVGEIKTYYAGKICENADIATFVRENPCELAYALALIDTSDHRSVTPGWVLANFPKVETIIRALRHTRCAQGCPYCASRLDVTANLQRIFGYKQFRTYEGEPLQQLAAQAAVDDKSLLAIFPTGGGKSLTFQLPAMMAGLAVHGLTVVISPLQSLMKDQVDNLIAKGISEVVTINGLLDPISRSSAIQRVIDGEASLLYISPEMLRSMTIERILLARNVVRFVIDEAHCFSAWGQDFRVDYMYIGEFIKKYQQAKGLKRAIPVSCFTATAKQKVVQDICDYFRQTLGLELQLYASTATRTNLHYSVIHVDTDNDKYAKLRGLISQYDCPTIIYVSRTKRTYELAQRLTRDGYRALPFNGKMEADNKITNQNAFMKGDVDIIVATSAFGMGVDKSDVGLVIHYDISDSLENYVQEAGRAGRDPNLTARCFVLYNESDLDKHFILLNQTKLSLSEIQQIWKALKDLTRKREHIRCSALEIARQAGWDDSVYDIETRVRTALATLEQGGYIQRGNNVPHVYATGITVKNMDEARAKIVASALFSNDEAQNAIRIIKSLISQKYITKAQNAEAESRIDYLADILGISKREVVSAVERMRQEGILADSRDITAFLLDGNDSARKSQSTMDYFMRLEGYILRHIPDGALCLSYKQLNDNAINDGITNAKEKDIHTLIYFLTIKGYTRKKVSATNLHISRQADLDSTLRRYEKRINVCRLVIDYLYEKAVSASGGIDPEGGTAPDGGKAIQFSVVELLNWIKPRANFVFANNENLQIEDVEEALLYLSQIGALKLDGGFLVLYNAMDIRRLKDTKLRYRQADYRMLDQFYKQKMQQVHIVGEYANLMVKDYDAALQFVSDYFQIDYKKFIAKYFKGERVTQIERNLTPKKYDQLFGQLSPRQIEIISDKETQCIVVAAGPGSGKTRVLVHKLASLLLLEDVKHEQLLMLTFSRAAATEFKQRLMGLIGNAAHFVEIKTFHAYCFDLLGRIGNLDDAKDVVARAAQMIEAGDVEPSRIAKAVLVIDEAQDLGPDEYRVVKALMSRNEEMRVIAVGDDDQGIYEFRGSNSGYLYQLAQSPASRLIEMTDNYRSQRHVVAFANEFVKRIRNRIKVTPIRAISSEAGYVAVTKHASEYMYDPLVQDIARHIGNTSACVLTQTNEEAVITVALLKKHGIKASLIQSLGNLRFWNIAEMRYFMKQIESRISTPVIPEEVWLSAISATSAAFARSANLEYVIRCATLFDQTNKAKYLSDFKEYVFESSIEDFRATNDDGVIVSTIHKSKGREFDDVYMLVSDKYGGARDDHKLRALYVGMTRAKSRLFIHTDSSIFDSLPADRHESDPCQYEMPRQVALQLSHKDVFLNFFEGIKERVFALQACDPLTYNGFVFFSPQGHPVAKLSKGMEATLAEWQRRGYAVTAASVRFIVAWKPKGAGREVAEYAVLLPDLILAKGD